MCKYMIPETFDDINFWGYYYQTFWTLASKLGHFIIVHLVKLNSLTIKKELGLTEGEGSVRLTSVY
jgi:hypothetical protein